MCLTPRPVCSRAARTCDAQIKNVFDASIGALVWWLWGYGIALGSDTYASTGKNGFWGQTYYTASETNGYGDAMWLFQWAFAGAAATIVSGAVAERVTFTAYIIYSIVLTGFICKCFCATHRIARTALTSARHRPHPLLSPARRPRRRAQRLAHGRHLLGVARGLGRR